MTTKNSGVGLNRGIYESPYDAFTNYMNILGDFIKRVDSLYPVDIDNEELNALLTTIKNQGDEIEELHKELEKAQNKLEKEKAAEKLPNLLQKKPHQRRAPRRSPKSKVWLTIMWEVLHAFKYGGLFLRTINFFLFFHLIIYN